MILGVPSRPGLRIMVAAKPIDFRKGMDSLAALVKQALASDPFTGDVFIFRSKRGDRLKVLYWDSDGLCLFYKRLEVGVFSMPTLGMSVGAHGLEIRVSDLTLMLEGIDLASAKRRKRYQRPTASAGQ